MDAPPPTDDPHYDLAMDLLQGGIVMVNGDLLLGLRPVDDERAGDRLDSVCAGGGSRNGSALQRSVQQVRGRKVRADGLPFW